jgi:class 3 adenylate cyclase/tetratricopeptide (TPR) repeat protein
MRRILREIGGVEVPGGRVMLRMSAGIHSGEFHFFLVGDSHRELVVAGPGATTTVSMEAAAEAGEIVVSPATAQHLPHRVLGVPRGQGLLLRASPPGFSRHRPANEPRVDPAMAAECIPEGLRAYVLGGVHEPGHRQVTVAFVHFGELDALVTTAGAEAAAAALQALVSRIQKAADRHDLTFLGSDVAADGGKVILVAGAPRAVDNPAERMLLALRQIADTADMLPLQIGVTNGHVFAGDIGPPYRQTYTVMGDAVNLSARLMAAAGHGQILATPEVLRGSRAAFETTALEPFMVKGKARPVCAVVVGAPRERPSPAKQQLPLVGRDGELSSLLDALDAALRGAGNVVEVVGEPGMGKSRLLAELRERAQRTTVLTAACAPYETSTPYFPFRGLLRGLLGAAQHDGDDDALRRLEAAVDDGAPHLRPWLPLLAAVLGVHVPPTPEIEQLGDEFRRPRLHAVVDELLSGSLSAGALLTVEDAHWMDEASADLLAHLAGAVAERPWLLCVTRRDVATGFAPTTATHVRTMQLGSLDAEQAAAFLAATIGSSDSRLAAHEAAALVERSGGNPLFLQELASASVSDGGVLPDSLEGLLAARIDALHPDDRSLLRRVAVLGQDVSPELLPAVLETVPSTADPIWERLSGLLERELSGSFRFHHALIRDVAYEGLPFRLRHGLHARIAERIEQTAHDPTDDAERLSFHFFEAQRYDRAWTYSRLAAERARALYANVDAARFYERALEAARHLKDLDRAEVAATWEALGGVWQHVGDYTSAAKAYGTARRLVVAAPVTDARLLLKQGILQGWLSRYPNALRWIRRGLRTLDGLDTPEAGRQRAQLSVWYARFCAEGGSFAKAIDWCHRTVDEAIASDEPDALAHAYRLLDWAYARTGEVERATYSVKALAIYHELGDLAGQNAALNNMAILMAMQGEWSNALVLLQRMLDLAARIGDQRGVAIGKYNIADVLCDQGRLAEADALLGDALRISRAAGDRDGVATASRNQGRVAARMGRFEEALRILEEARTEFEDLGARFDAVDTLASIAECHVLRGDANAALETVRDAMGQASGLGGIPELSTLLHRLHGNALMQLGDLDRARTAFEASLAAGRPMQADYQVALTLRALVDLAALDGSTVRADLEEESRATLERLGVVRVPHVPLEDRSALPSGLTVRPSSAVT